MISFAENQGAQQFVKYIYIYTYIHISYRLLIFVSHRKGDTEVIIR
jgi:hypothetical protein